MATIPSIKTSINSVIRTETAAGGITPTEVSDLMDAILNEVRDRGILWVANYTAVTGVDPADSKQAGDISTGNVYRHNGSTWVLILEPGAGSGGGGLITLATPTLTATPNGSSGDTVIDLSWTNVANESSYLLEFSPNGSTGWTQIGGTIAANTTTYQHTGRTASTQYWYRITAVGDGVTYSNSGYGTDDTTTSAGGAYDTDAQAVIDAIEATDTLLTGKKDAINTFIAGLKTDGLWTNSKVIRGYVGGSANAHKWNWRNPLNTDAAFRAVFGGTLTHDDNGVTIGAGGYVQTFFNPSVDYSSASAFAHGVYLRAAATGSFVVMGAGVGSRMLATYNDGVDNVQWAEGWGGTLGSDKAGSATPSGRTRLNLLTRTSASVMKYFRDATQVGSTATGAPSTPPNDTFAVGCNHSGGAYGLNAVGETICFEFFYNGGLSDAQVIALNSRVNALQTALGRNV